VQATDKTREKLVKKVSSLRQQVAALEGAEELLQKERDTLFSILEKAPYGVVFLDKDGKTIFINTEFTAITGYTLEDVPTISDWFRLAYPDKQYGEEISASETWMRDKAQRETDNLFRKMLKRVFFRAFSVVCKDGTIKEIEFRPTILNDGSTIVMLADITERKRAEEALQDSEERYRTLVDNIKFGITLIDNDHNIIMVNAVQSALFKKPANEMIGKKCFREFEKRDAVCPHCPGVQAMATGQSAEAEADGVRDDGSHIYARIQAFPAFGHDGTLTGFIEVVEDITERKQAEKALRASEGRYRSLVEFTEDPVYLIDRGKRYLFINEKYLSRLGVPRDHVIGKQYGEFHCREDEQEFSGYIEQVLTTGWFVQYEHRSRSDGRYFLRTLSPVQEPDGSIEMVTVISKDITERKQAEKKLAHMATHDFLTNLPNRILLNDRLNMALAQARRHQQRICLMLLDLDYFKDINDTLGHSVGDKLLRVVGERLTGLLRTSDTIARMGGDEFLLLLSEIDRVKNVTIIAQKILESFRKAFSVDDHELIITTSIGIAIFPDDGDDADALLKNADIAMYRAKERGRDNFQFYSSTPS
jgi:diguanylate cyclase (GGDEF)-like protein/PAS domain S-box-containing protein